MSESSEKKKLPLWLILLMAGVALVINQSFWQWRDIKNHEYNNTPAGKMELESEQLKIRKKIIEAETERMATSGQQQVPVTATFQPSIQQQEPRLVTQSSTPAVELRDGAMSILPENARIVLHGPITNMVISNTAWRIKSSSGEFKLVLDADGSRAWTPSFTSRESPSSMEDFISRLPKWPEQSRVRIFVQPGATVELNT